MKEVVKIKLVGHLASVFLSPVSIMQRTSNGIFESIRTSLKLIYCFIVALYVLCTHQYKTLSILPYRANGAKH